MDTRQQLLSNAEVLIASHGPDGFSLRALVRQAGQRNTAALQYHFRDRTGLIRAWQRWRLNEINRLIPHRPMPATTDVGLHALLERLVQPFVTALQHRLANDGSSHALRCLARLGPPEFPDHAPAPGSGWRNPLQETWTALHARLPEASADWRMALFWSALSGGLARLEADYQTTQPDADGLAPRTAQLIDCLAGLLQGLPDTPARPQ